MSRQTGPAPFHFIVNGTLVGCEVPGPVGVWNRGSVGAAGWRCCPGTPGRPLALGWPPAGGQPDLTSMGGLALRAGLNTLPSAPSAGPHLAGTKWEVEFHPCSDLTPAARRLQLVPNLNLAI